MRRPTSSTTLASTTAVCQRWFTTNSTGSTFLDVWSTSWLSWSVGVWRTKHQGIWSTAALQSPTLPVDIDDQPTCIVWSFRGIDVAHSVGGSSLSGVRPSGIHCLSNCVDRLWATVSFSAHWRRSSSRDILVHRAQLRCFAAFAWNCAIKFILTLTLTKLRTETHSHTRRQTRRLRIRVAQSLQLAAKSHSKSLVIALD